MGKALLLSIVVSMIAIPARMARTKDPKAGLRKMIRNVILFNLFYWFNLMFLYGRF